MNFIKKHWSNLLFFGLLIFMFTPPGMPLRTLLIKGVSYITSRVETLEIDADKQVSLNNYNWNLIDLHGNETDFSQFQNNVIVLNNWATWCPPCVAEMPGLQHLYKQYKNQVIFVFIAHDKPEKVQAFLQKNNLDIPVYFVTAAMPEVLQSSSIPTTFIIDKKGKIVVRKTGAADWNSGQVHKILEKYLSR